MSITRKFLKGMGLTEEQVDTIIEEHTSTTDALKDEVKKYKADAEKLADVQKELNKAKDDLAAADADGWKGKYDAVKKEFDGYKTEQTKKETRAVKESAYRELLKSAGVSEKRIDTIIKVSGERIDAIKLVDGKLSDDDAKTMTESVKTEWGDFIVKSNTSGASTKTPPANEGGKSTKTKAEILAIKDAGERQKAIAENPEAFGITTF